MGAQLTRIRRSAANNNSSGQPRISVTSDNAVRLRVGQDFLCIECHNEEPSLVSQIQQAIPDQHYTFYLEDVNMNVDTPDGNIPLLKTLTHRKHDGKTVYISAKKSFRRRPFAREITLEEAKKVTESAIWNLKYLPGDNWILESYKFRKMCLSNHEGQLCLERVSKARRSRRCRFYEVRAQGTCR